MLFLKLYHCDFFRQPAALIKSAFFRKQSWNGLGLTTEKENITDCGLLCLVLHCFDLIKQLQTRKGKANVVNEQRTPFV